MRKTLSAAVLLLALSCPAAAGIIQNGQPAAASDGIIQGGQPAAASDGIIHTGQPAAAADGTIHTGRPAQGPAADGETPNNVTGALAQALLAALLSVLP